MIKYYRGTRWPMIWIYSSNQNVRDLLREYPQLDTISNNDRKNHADWLRRNYNTSILYVRSDGYLYHIIDQSRIPDTHSYWLPNSIRPRWKAALSQLPPSLHSDLRRYQRSTYKKTRRKNG